MAIQILRLRDGIDNVDNSEADNSNELITEITLDNTIIKIKVGTNNQRVDLIELVSKWDRLTS